MIYLQLFISFFQIGLFSIGGGYAAMPLIQQQVVEEHTWLTLSQFTDLITIAEMTPGPIAINSATFVGTTIAGTLGAVIATLGCILPSCFIASALAVIYYKYKNIKTLQEVLASLRPAVVALIASAGLAILSYVAFDNTAIAVENIHWLGMGIFFMAFVALRKFKCNPILAMSLCGVCNLVVNLPSVLA